MSEKQHPYKELVIDYASEWIIPSADDDKGHNITEQVCLPKTWIAQMDRMVKYANYPYINRGQIIRHGLFMLFSWIETLPKKKLPKSNLSKIESMRTLLIEEAMIAGFQEVLTELDKRVKFCKSKKLLRRAVRQVLDILRIAEELKDNDWKGQFVNEIKARYKQLLDSVEDVRLCSIDENED